eukprot:UN00667
MHEKENSFVLSFLLISFPSRQQHIVKLKHVMQHNQNPGLYDA